MKKRSLFILSGVSYVQLLNTIQHETMQWSPFSDRNSGYCAIKSISLYLSSSSSFEGHPLQVRHKQDWSRGFILLLPQTAALPESDADSGVIKPASSFFIQNRQTSCSMWCPMYRARC